MCNWHGLKCTVDVTQHIWALLWHYAYAILVATVHRWSFSARKWFIWSFKFSLQTPSINCIFVWTEIMHSYSCYFVLKYIDMAKILNPNYIFFNFSECHKKFNSFTIITLCSFKTLKVLFELNDELTLFYFVGVHHYDFEKMWCEMEFIVRWCPPHMDLFIFKGTYSTFFNQ